MLEEEEKERHERCPNCESQRIHFDEDRDVRALLSFNLLPEREQFAPSLDNLSHSTTSKV